MTTKVCFFAPVRDRQLLDRCEFYAQDIRILRELGFEIHIATHPLELRFADLYFVWWWTWAIFPIALARLSRGRVLITGTFDVNDFNKKAFWHKRLIRRALRQADANVLVSQMEYKQIPEQFNTSHPCYAPHTVDTSVYKPKGSRSKNLVLSVGWLEAGNAFRKGMFEIVRAAPLIHSDHPEVCFVIAGGKGSDYPALEQAVRELGAGSYIKFPGAISTEEKIELMQSCAVYLQPSRFEGFGLAILEAMSCGAAVVTTAAGAVPEVVGDTGVQVEAGSPESIAGEVNRLLADGPLRTHLGENARRRAETVYPYARRKQDLQNVIEGLFQNAPETQDWISARADRARPSEGK
jgi:glycosyltransferase involved in cell wall biosynthesis